MALVESLKLPLGSKIVPFNLLGVDGNEYSVSSFREQLALVIVFTCNHCPYAKAIESRLIDLQNKYEDQDVQVIAINSNDSTAYPEDSFENMKVVAHDMDYPFPYLHDKTQEVAKAYKAQCTPDLYVYDDDRKLVYHGRFDDNWEDETLVTSHDLEEAIISIIDGEIVEEKQFSSMGCSIKWRA